MNLLIVLTSAGLNSGPFNLYSDTDGYAEPPFETDVPKQDLLDGYISTLVPDGTTIVRIQSDNNLCTNYIDLSTGITTTTSTSSTTTTTTTVNTSCSTCSVGEVTIGTQIWSGCNLDISTYRNGDVIPEITDPTEWQNATYGAWCYPAGNLENCVTYGKLYNWYAVHDARGLAPIGYHIPTDTEWTTLTTYLGGNTIAGGKMKETGTAHWLAPNTGATNSSGFTGLPAGWRTNFGGFNNITNNGGFWSSTEVDSVYAWLIYLATNTGIANRYGYRKTYGFSVRLIKD